MNSHRLNLSLLGALSIGIAAPALAQPGAPPQPPMTVDTASDPRPEWPGAQTHAASAPASYDQVAYQRARADWLSECRSNRRHGKTIGGAVIGGLLGGVVGNRVAGDGDRVVGTVIGAAAGAAAGGAIGAGADRRAALDYCEAYLDRYTTQPSYGQGGYGQPVYGYAPTTVLMPVAMMPAAAPRRECKETIVTEEWVPTGPAPHYRTIPARYRVPDKRVRIVPDKRVRLN